MSMSDSPSQRSLADCFYGAVTVGERGQVVIPAEARKQTGLEPGEKLLVFRHPHLRGLVMARVDDMQALLAELQQWTELMAGTADGASPEAGAGK
jgi:AbrB family looped-hinge helix DNA binding protein